MYGSFDDQCIVAELRRPLPAHPPDYDAALSFDFVRDDDLYDGPGVVVHEIRNLDGGGSALLLPGHHSRARARHR